MPKVEDKERISKATWEKQFVMYKGTPTRVSVDFSAETFRPEESITIYSECWKVKTSIFYKGIYNL